MKKTAALFDERNEQKKKLDFIQALKGQSIEVGEIWWYYVGVNVGSEISKDDKFIRPCIVLQNNLGNGLVCIAPLTSTMKYKHHPFVFTIHHWKLYCIKESVILCNQIHCISKKRFVGKMSRKKFSI